MNKLIQFTKELNEYAKNNLNNEIIPKEDLIRAIYYMNNIFIESEEDILIFLSALNLCNAYIKQNKNNISYSFKKGITTIIKIANNYQFDNLKIYTTSDNGNLYLFQLGYIQFSFHDEKKVEINSHYYKKLIWDGVKKQSCAKTIFDKIINHKIFKQALTFEGENIYNKSCELISNYKNNKISFEDIINYYL